MRFTYDRIADYRNGLLNGTEVVHHEYITTLYNYFVENIVIRRSAHKPYAGRKGSISVWSSGGEVGGWEGGRGAVGHVTFIKRAKNLKFEMTAKQGLFSFCYCKFLLV